MAFDVSRIVNKPAKENVQAIDAFANLRCDFTDAIGEFRTHG